MTTANVTFLGAADLSSAFVVEASHCQDLAFCCDGAKPDWLVAWVMRDGQPEACVQHVWFGPEHSSFFLGQDPQQAMRRAVAIIRSWELPEGKPN